MTPISEASFLQQVKALAYIHGWVAVKYCLPVCSVLLGLFPVSCHVCDATSALASLRLLSFTSAVWWFVSPRGLEEVPQGRRMLSM